MLLLATLLLTFVGLSAAVETETAFCIIGGGPGGIQTAYWMQHYGMDVKLFERADGPASFFREFPRFRTLNSINKVFTGSDDAEFNMRHDWNSLVESTSTMRLGNFTKDYYPHADDLVRYMEDFVKRNNLDKNVIHYGHEVSSIRREKKISDLPDDSQWKSKANRRFVLSFSDDRHVPVKCRSIILATGRSVPYKPKFPGSELMVGCEDVSRDPTTYRNAEVLIWGSGNSALEFAQATEDETALIHIASKWPLKLAYQTHYTGHARARNLGILDRYLLKSMDALVPGMDEKQIRLMRKDSNTGRIFLELDVDEFEWSPFRRGYHFVVCCLGYTWNTSAFGSGKRKTEKPNLGGTVPVQLVEDSDGKFPVVASNFESVNVPDAFVAGALMHFRDYKRSAGGFIYGFRYLAHTLVLQLRERYLDIPYPMVRITTCPKGERSSKQCVAPILDHIAGRLTNASSLFHMNRFLSDVITLNPKSKQSSNVEFVAHHDIPLDQATSADPGMTNIQHMSDVDHFLTISLEYGPQYQGTGVLHFQGQEEVESRKKEQQLWQQKTDPDWLLGNAGRLRGVVSDGGRLERPSIGEDEKPQNPFEFLENMTPFEPVVEDAHGREQPASSREGLLIASPKVPADHHERTHHERA